VLDQVDDRCHVRRQGPIVGRWRQSEPRQIEGNDVAEGGQARADDVPAGDGSAETVHHHDRPAGASVIPVMDQAMG